MSREFVILNEEDRLTYLFVEKLLEKKHIRRNV